jgi:hypothetical protein
MISLVKILFTVAVVYAVWFIFKYRARIAAAHKAVMEGRARAGKGDAAARPPSTPLAQDLLPCPKCGSYIAQGTQCSCEKV